MSQDMLPKAEPASFSVEHQQMAALINSMSEGVLAMDGQLNITLTNGVVLDLLDANVLTGKSVTGSVKLYDAEDKELDLAGLVKPLTSVFSSRNLTVKYSDGSSANLAVTISPVRSGYGDKTAAGWVMVMRDITAEKSLEEERDDFISVASHELRTPIAVTEGNISNALLQAEKSGASEEIRASLAAAHDQTLFLGNLVNDLAMLSRANRGKLALSVQPFEVSSVLKELVQDYSGQAEAKGLKLELNLEEGLGQLNSSELYVREILQNFITNSLKYTEKGTITLAAHADSNGAVFTVSDTGIGISKSDQNRLFKKFFRSNDWRVQKASGTGLGLYVTAKLIKLLGANLSMESELNKGTAVTLAVPNIVVHDPPK